MTDVGREAVPATRNVDDPRLWPGVVIVVLQWAVTFGSGYFAPGTPIQFYGMMGGPLIGTLALFVWWVFASRGAWKQRVIAVGLMVLALAAAAAVLHPTMGMALFLYGLPLMCLAFVAWAALTRGWPVGRQRLALIATLIVVCGGWALLRSDGVTGDLWAELAWRWGQTDEDRYLARSDPGAAPVAVAASAAPAARPGTNEWPGFRGLNRKGVVSLTQLATDWAARPPELVWRRPVGPGWSSFAIAGDLLFTQEQRGDDEVVACHRASTGEPVWQHLDKARFWEAMAGTGPRATPTLHEGVVYALGATGILNALEARSGAPVWSRDAAADSAAPTPPWGFAASPLVVDDLIVVHTGAPAGKAVAAYRRDSGEPSWFAPAGAHSYSSAQLETLGGVRQILILTGDGATSLAPEDGAVLWKHAWPMDGDGSRIVQPGITADGGVLIGTGFGMGVRRLGVTLRDGAWTVNERWTSSSLKPYFNDFVIHRGHAYGFDGRVLACVALENGKRQWKGGRYGYGQLLLLPDQDLLLVLSEKGEIALVSADPAGYSELARSPAIEGKTWNHPVLVDDMLYVRNGKEMAAYRLPTNASAGTG